MADEDNTSPTSVTSNVMPLILVSHPLHRSHPATTPSLASSLKPAANNDPATPPIVGLLPRQEPLVSFSRTHHAVKTKRDNDNENSLVAPWHGPSNGCSRTAASSQTIRELSTPEHVGRIAGDRHDGHGEHSRLLELHRHIKAHRLHKPWSHAGNFHDLLQKPPENRN